MFAGVGCFSLIICRHSKPSKVYSIDINPDAVGFMKENVRINGQYGKVIPILGDAREIIETRLRGIADRVIMPLPEKALAYLPAALSALKGSGGWIHYHDFVYAGKGEDPIREARTNLLATAKELRIAVGSLTGRVVRTTGPRWYHVVLDMKVNGT